MSSKIKAGLIGTGHLGNIHLKLLREHPEFTITGFFDTNSETARKISSETGLQAFSSPEELIAANDVVDIVTPTSSHYIYARQAIKAGKHVFIEKPVTETDEQARELVSLAEEAGVKVQVGHVERFNPVFLKACAFSLQPRFIEAHRLSEFNPRGTDVSVVMDLMIHDIDLALHMVNAPVSRVSASGVSVISDTPDIANARIVFDNGSVANLTASRISMKRMRKMRLFQPNAYISMDFLEKTLEVVSLTAKGAGKGKGIEIPGSGQENGKEVHFYKPEVEPVNAIYEELSSFAGAIRGNNAVGVSIDEAYQALRVANAIQEQITSMQVS